MIQEQITFNIDDISMIYCALGIAKCEYQQRIAKFENTSDESIAMRNLLRKHIEHCDALIKRIEIESPIFKI